MSQPLAETAIEVVADTEPFEDDVEALGKRERRRKIKKPVEADTREMLRQIDRALDSLRGSEIEVDADTRRLITELDRALDGFTGDVDLDPDIQRLVAEVDAAIAGLSYEVPVEPKVLPPRDAKGRFQRLGTELGNDAADSFDRAFGPKVLNAVKKIGAGIGKVALPVGSIFLKAAAGALAFVSALQTISGLVAALGPAIGLALGFLPGFLLARALAMGVFKLAVVGVADALGAAAEGDAKAFEKALEKLSPAAREFAIAAKEAIDSLRPLQQLIQDTAFAGLADDVTAAGKALQGTRDDAASVALQFNRIAAEALGFAASDQAIGSINSGLGLVRDVLFAILPTIRPLLAAFAGLAAQAGQFGEAIGGALAAGLTRLADFIAGVDLAAVFEAALPTLRALGTILTNVGNIATAVFEASGASGAGLLDTIAGLTTVLATFLQSAGGLAALQSLMGAVAQVGEALGGALGVLLPPLGAAIGAIAIALGPLAQVLGQVLQAVAPLLPPLGQLIAVLGGALVSAITPLIPVISSLATLIGSSLTALAPVLGQIGTTIGQILAPAAELLAELFRQLAPVIADVGAQVGTTLAPLLRVLGPLFAQILESLMPLIPSLVALIPPLLEIAVALLPLIELTAQLLTVLVAVVAPIIQLAAELLKLLVINGIVPQIELFAAVLGYIIAPLTSVSEKLGEFSAWLNAIDWAGVGAAISGAFQTAWNAVVAAVEGIVAFVTALPGRLLAVLAAMPGLVAELFRRMGQLALQAVGVAIGLLLFQFLVLPGKIMAGLNALPGLIRGLFSRAVSAGRAAAVAGFNAIVSFVNNVPQRVGAALNRLTSIVSNAVSRAASSGRSRAVAGFNSIVSYVASVPGRIGALAGRFASAGARLVASLVNGLKRVPSLGSIGSAIAGVIRSQANNIVGAINRGISQVDAILPGSLPRIPGFARGAVVDDPTLGVFGEAGREVIIPLERPQRARELAQESGLDRILTGGQGGSPIYVSLRAYLGDQEISNMISFEVDRQLDDTAAQVDAGVRAF